MDKKDQNFKDPITGETFFCSPYRAVIVNDEVVYKDSRTGKEVVNPKTGTVLELIKDGAPIGVPLFAKFNHRSLEGQKNIKAHFGSRASRDNRVGTGRDEKDQKVNDFKKELGVRKKKGNLPI